MKTRHVLASLATASMLFAMPTFAADTAQDFVDKAAVGAKFEVDSSKIAQDKAHDQSVKDFAQKMIQDHGAANAKLEAVAAAQKLKVPAELDTKHKDDLERLQNADAPVDQPYVEMQRSAHADAVKLFEIYARDGDTASLKTFAQENLPTLKMHQEMIEKIAATKNAATGATTPAVKTTDTPSAAAPVPGATALLKTKPRAASRMPATRTYPS
ncbi:Outer membrane protein-like protein [Mesorhizobium metallidurans STM 2683]|uniref:Outer membrane protein-like protein n=1 Tax=Mesorhizobium metallidurans STM 2683 TaxID=1297569 RepID=M5EMS8_9HYPH|nr:Outer membrane protein-like protein [Mesorhizobium metallidurans STM 2683]